MNKAVDLWTRIYKHNLCVYKYRVRFINMNLGSINNTYKHKLGVYKNSTWFINIEFVLMGNIKMELIYKHIADIIIDLKWIYKKVNIWITGRT